jgi:hypothetical protein
MQNKPDIIPVAQWLEMRGGAVNHQDGRGKFVRNGEWVTDAPFDDVFGDVPADVTHIAWLNRWKNWNPQPPSLSGLQFDLRSPAE